MHGRQMLQGTLRQQLHSRQPTSAVGPECDEGALAVLMGSTVSPAPLTWGRLITGGASWKASAAALAVVAGGMLICVWLLPAVSDDAAAAGTVSASAAAAADDVAGGGEVAPESAHARASA